MEITEVRIKLTSGRNEKLRAFCSVTIDNDFVVRDLKVIEGAKGAFVAMPSRKLMARCHRCPGKNHYRALYCNECGCRLSGDAANGDPRRKLHADVAHPINSECRESIQRRVLDSYLEELDRAKDPDYRPQDLDVFDDEEYFDDDEARLTDVAPTQRKSVPSEPELVGAAHAEEEEWEKPGAASAGSHPVAEPRSSQDRDGAPSRRRRGDRRGRDRSRSGDDRRGGRAPHWRQPQRGTVTQDAAGGRLGGEPRLDASPSDRVARERFEAGEPSGARGGSRLQPERVREPQLDEHDEPEDNFGAGLFS